MLVKFDVNWADEMDLYGFEVCTVTQWKDYAKWIRGLPGEFWNATQFYLGTNEETTFDTGEEFLTHFKVTPISDEDAKTLCRLFDRNTKKIQSFSWGTEISVEEYYTDYLEQEKHND